MICVTESKRPRKDNRRTGVKVGTYFSNTIKEGKGEYIYIKFMGQDVDKLAYMIRIELNDDKTRMYFEPSEKGFTLSPEHKSDSSYVVRFAIKKEYRSFIGEYPKLLYDENEHLFFIDKADKVGSDKESITLSKDEYDKLMQLVETFTY